MKGCEKFHEWEVTNVKGTLPSQEVELTLWNGVQF